MVLYDIQCTTYNVRHTLCMRVMLTSLDGVMARQIYKAANQLFITVFGVE